VEQLELGFDGPMGKCSRKSKNGKGKTTANRSVKGKVSVFSFLAWECVEASGRMAEELVGDHCSRSCQ